MDLIISAKTEQELQTLIDNGVEESLTLEYKGAGALSRDQRKKDEITKDVSALANSAGGILIYGIEEGNGATQHIPQRITPVDRNQFAKEWLEQIIHTIQPRIANLVIVPVPLSSGSSDVAYVVVVPKSSTAHQAADRRYYRRFNFMSVPMEDHEVRDVMNRSSLPVVELRAELECDMHDSSRDMGGMSFPRQEPYPIFWLSLIARNTGDVIAQFIEGSVEIPTDVLHRDESYESNVIKFSNHLKQPTGQGDMMGPRMGNPQWMPILPRSSRRLTHVRVGLAMLEQLNNLSLPWKIRADTAGEKSGVLTRESIEIKQTREFTKALERSRDTHNQ